MNYLPYKTRFTRSKITSSSILDTYLNNIGYDEDTIQLLIHEPQENDYHLMHDLDKMVNYITELYKQIPKYNTVFTIVGDYDADGATSTSILYLILVKLGFIVHYYIPHRIHDGYGLKEKIVDKIIELYSDTNIIITCDNGIAAVDAVKYANEKGFQVFITDHHKPDMNNLPNADYIVHPALPGYPFAEISGATVAYKIAKALMDKNGIHDNELSEYILQLAAISVVSDVMPVASKDIDVMRVNENRTILKNGIKLMRENPNWRLKTMFKMLKIQGETLDETTIGFYVAPVINAVGRLDDASEAVAFLTAESEDKAILKCSIMDYLNKERKKLKSESLEIVKKTLDISKPALIVKAEDIHEGIIGIIAGNLVDAYQKPAVIFAKCEVDGKRAWKASARSTEDINLYKVLSEINDKKADVIYAFGGHAGAAGLTVLDVHIDEFIEMFQEYIASTNRTDINKYYIPITADNINKFAKALVEIKPLGNGLPKPLINTHIPINQYDFFYSSKHVKISYSYYKTELWLFSALDEFLSNKNNILNFIKVSDNTEKRLLQNKLLTHKEAEDGRWERWKTDDNIINVFFDCILELDYGPFMGNVSTILSAITCKISES